MEKLGSIIFGLIIGSLFFIALLYGFEKEDRLIETHCSNLQGYEYGICQSGIQ